MAQSGCTPVTQKNSLIEVWQKWSIGERIFSPNNFHRGLDLDFWPLNFAQGHCTADTKRLSVNKVWVWFGQGERMYGPVKDSTY